MFHQGLVLSSLFFASALGSYGGCVSGNPPDIEFQPIVGGSFNVDECNVDPSQVGLGVAFGVSGRACADGGVSVFPIISYTNVAGQAQAEYATPIGFGMTTSTAFTVEFTNVPYSIMSPGAPATVFFEFWESTLNSLQISTYSWVQDFQSTIFYATATSTVDVTVPSTAVTTSTVTETAVSTAAAVTVDITSAVGTITSTAKAATKTVVTTITPKPVKSTIVDVITHKVTRPCYPPKHHNGSVRRRNLEARDVNLLSFELPFCSDKLTSTTYTTSTTVVVSTVTVGVTTSTSYASSTTTSVFTPTETVYHDVDTIITVTPKASTQTLTDVLKPVTQRVTRTVIVEKTVYPPNAHPCKTQTV